LDRLRTQTIPYIILTSSEDQEKEINNFSLGAVGYEVVQSLVEI